MKSIKVYSILSFIFICLILMNFQCNDCEDEIHDEVNYTVSLSSSDSTFEIGDTLILSTSNNSMMTLENSQATIDNSQQPLQFRVRVFEGLPDEIRSVASREKFEYFEIDGQVFIPQSRVYEVEISNVCNDSMYNMSFGMVMQEEGYFGIALESGWVGADLCEFITYFPDSIEVERNNFEIFSEINIDRIFIDGSRYSEESGDKLLFFFKVEM